MKLKAVSGVMLILLLIGMLMLEFDIQPVKAESLYYSFQINVLQQSPPTDNNVNATVILFLGSTYSVTFGSLSQINNDFLVYIDVYVPEFALPIVFNMTKTYRLGELPAGSYNFAAFVTVSGYGSDFDAYYKSFTVRTTHVYPGESIQEAINSTQHGDTILVHNGTYIEDVVVNKSISLVGENEENTIIYGSGNGTVVYVFADNVNISRFTIRNSGNLFFDGGIYLNKSQGCRVDGNRINVEGSGIIVSRGYENHLINNRIGPEYSWYGIYLINSSGNIIVGNAQSTSDIGIRLVTGSCHNNISGNHIINNICANICLDSTSHNNTITNNKIYSPGPIPAGSILVESEGNAVYHNNFYNGIEEPIIVYHANNVWDNGYPSGGNYWSDHNPPDIYSGPYQNETGRDKIGDIPYVIDGNNTDRYPLIYPYGYVPTLDLDGDGVISIIDIVTVALAFGSRPGDPHWNPYADINQDGVVDIQDIVILAIHFGETW
jgi:parallel beta-helix repeat protein